jgi:hypothetical protein
MDTNVLVSPVVTRDKCLAKILNVYTGMQIAMTPTSAYAAYPTAQEPFHCNGRVSPRLQIFTNHRRIYRRYGGRQARWGIQRALGMEIWGEPSSIQHRTASVSG